MKFLQLLLIAAALLALFACSGDPDGGGASIISLNGGAGVNHDPTVDGHGGYLEIYSAGDIKLAKSGYPDATFTSYESNQHDFGANKATVSADTTVLLDPGADPGPRVLYVRTDDQNLYVGGGTDLVVTGLEVTKGATLKLPANFDSGMWANVLIDHDVIISGTLTTANESVDLEFGSGSLIIIGMTGKVTTAATTVGNNGGGIWLYSHGALVNLGSVDCSGASGGGSAINALLYADNFILNTGSITANGGDGDSMHTQGGSGGSIGISSGHAKIFSSGMLNANGGAGTAGPGGQAGNNITIAGATGVDLVYSSIILNGGSGAANGGSAGGVIIFQMQLNDINNVAKGAVSNESAVSVATAVGSISNDVPITARGGNGAMSGGYRGGDGGYVYFGRYLTDPSTGAYGLFTTNIINSGTIDSSGGNGDIGGNCHIFKFSATDKVTNSAAITGNGGNGVTQGGLGAYISLWAINHAVNSGAITANGGAATINGGNGGLIVLFSVNAPPTTNSGALSVVKGGGGTTAINGVIIIDGSVVTPPSGAI